MTDSLSIINFINTDEPTDFSSYLEKAGDLFSSPGRLLLGRVYYLETGNQLKSYNEQPILLKIIALVLFPFSFISTLFGLALKKASHVINPDLSTKYNLSNSKSPLIYAATKDNLNGSLPQNPFSPNCVNSQQTSIWGKQYNADPFAIISELGVDGTLEKLHNVILNILDEKPSLVERDGRYFHYEMTVVIKNGILKGTYIDDLILCYNPIKNVIDVRSSSRKGFRDALNLDLTKPGKNKDRIESIRQKVYLS